MDAPQLLPHRSWPELVMHVLAHVEGTSALPSSVYDARYVAWAEQTLGPAQDRALGEDIATLARTLPDHQSLARAQLLAWLFDDVPTAQSTANLDLASLSESNVARRELLEPLRAQGPAIELLRCAALLEAEAHALLIPPPPAPKVIERLRGVTPAAPRLANASVMCLRALRLRGRVYGDEIWVGAPSIELGPDAEHVAWQAAHEATVAELSTRKSDAGERDIEHAAVVLLAQRARTTDLAERHASWFAHFGDDAPAVTPASLTATARALLLPPNRG